jgi:hypothetical protein
VDRYVTYSKVKGVGRGQHHSLTAPYAACEKRTRRRAHQFKEFAISYMTGANNNRNSLR